MSFIGIWMYARSFQRSWSVFHQIKNPIFFSILKIPIAELRAEILNQNDKERDFREQLERQLNEEQRIRRKFRRRILIAKILF